MRENRQISSTDENHTKSLLSRKWTINTTSYMTTFQRARFENGEEKSNFTVESNIILAGQ